MKKSIIMLAAVAASVFAVNASAAGVQWDRAQLSYQKTSIDVASEFPDVDLDGFAFDLTKNYDSLLVTAGYGTTSGTVAEVGPEKLTMAMSYATFGLGMKASVTDAVDVYGIASYENWWNSSKYYGVSEFEKQSARDDGYGVRLGAKAQVGKVELAGGLKHINLTDSSTGYELAANYFLTEKFVAGVGYEDIDDYSNVKFTLAYSF